MVPASDDVDRLCRGFRAQRLSDGHENETREIEIPSDKVGLIIGSRGATIKGLQLDAKKHGAHLELMQSELQGRHPARVVIKANSSVVADLLEAEVIRTARLIEPDDASTLSAAATAENRRTSWRPSWKDPSFGIVPWTKVGERFYCLVQVGVSSLHHAFTGGVRPDA